jgi:hypothetical protein
MNFGNVIQDMTMTDMYELWLDRRNRKGFEYEADEYGKKVIKHDYIYFYHG